MTRLTRLGAYAIAAACFGCGSPSEDSATQVADTPPDAAVVDSPLLLQFLHADGGMEPSGVFADKAFVHLRTRVELGGTFADGDLAFVVVDAAGNQLSSDALACRRFRVGMGVARINEVYAGVDTDGSPCLHVFGVHDNGTLLPRLAPYADAAVNADGNMEFTVLVARVEHIVDGVFPADAARGTFVVAGPPAPPPPVCGDGHVDAGESCDDGNTTGGDGCSSTCQHESDHPCCCGDGIINAGESCDDGNLADGDGCSASCAVEH